MSLNLPLVCSTSAIIHVSLPSTSQIYLIYEWIVSNPLKIDHRFLFYFNDSQSKVLKKTLVHSIDTSLVFKVTPVQYLLIINYYYKHRLQTSFWNICKFISTFPKDPQPLSAIVIILLLIISNLFLEYLFDHLFLNKFTNKFYNLSFATYFAIHFG